MLFDFLLLAFLGVFSFSSLMILAGVVRIEKHLSEVSGLLRAYLDYVTVKKSM